MTIVSNDFNFPASTNPVAYTLFVTENEGYHLQIHEQTNNGEKAKIMREYFDPKDQESPTWGRFAHVLGPLLELEAADGSTE